jgi:predicted metal-dependent phosphoesterase TrpH
MPADLHTHTTASDGQCSPAALVQLARQEKLDVVAVTDHDTTSGIIPAQVAARCEIEIIPGIEIGARSNAHKADILGYFINIHHPGLQQRLEKFRLDREQRAQAILAQLARLGIALEWDQVVALAQGDSVGRPHIAQALVEAGHVTTMPEAFERYIGSKSPAFVSRATIDLTEAINLIHAAGGVAVLAHPVYVRDFPTVVAELVEAGLDGIEVCYPDHTPDIEAQARDLAERYHLMMTGGSDFHGLDVPGKAMLGSVTAPEGAVEALRERALLYSRRSPG